MGKKLRILADSLSEYLAENYQKVWNFDVVGYNNFQSLHFGPLKEIDD